MTSDTESQLASTVLMIRPVRFHANPLTARSNNFMQDIDASHEEQQAMAARAFDGVVAMLTEAGVNVLQYTDTMVPGTPDAVFPNNWVSTHADGRVVVYPMEAPNRRTERRLDIIESLAEDHGYRISELIDLSPHELTGHYLEGTGSLVLNRSHHIAYACLSSRTHLEGIGEFSQRLDYDVVAFEAADREGVPIYHTNVMMNVGDGFAVVCEESIFRESQRDAVRRSLEETGREVIPITLDQVQHMAGNMLEIASTAGETLLAMSTQARGSLTDEQASRLERYARIIDAPIDNIENSAGGSVRCMLAEIHLPMQEAHQRSGA